MTPDFNDFPPNPGQLESVPKIQGCFSSVGQIQGYPVFFIKKRVWQGITQFSQRFDHPEKSEKTLSVHSLEIEKSQFRDI